VTYLRSGQAAKALTALNGGPGKDDIDPSLFALAGQVYLQNGDAKKAEEYFAKALELNPDNAGMRTALAVAHLGGGDETSALDELQTIAGSDSGTTADLALISAHLKRNEFDKALAAVAKLQAKQPDKPFAPDLRGRIQLLQKDWAAARKSFEEALKIDPSYFSAIASLAALDLADKKPDDAKRRFEALLVRNPKNGQAALALAQLAVARGASKDEVAALLNKAIEAEPTAVSPRLALIDLYLAAKDNKQASTVAQNAVAALPNSPELLDALGRVQLQSGDLNQSISTFGKLAAMQPLLPMPQLRLAAAYMTNKDPQAAEQSLRKALELKPDDAQIQRGLIFVLIQEKKVPDAMTLARAAQKQRPKEALGYVFEGDIRASQRDSEGAAAAYRSGLQVAPATELAVKLHSVTTAAGKTAESERFAAAWMKAHPKDLQFLMYLGDSAVARKDYAGAEKNYAAVLQLQPDNAAALNNLAWTVHSLRKPGGVAYAEKANSLVPNQPEFMDTLALLLSSNGEQSRATSLELKALELQPTNAAFRLNLAKIYIAAGNRALARTELESVAKLGGTEPASVEAATLLKGL
jgi:cellulose synthase operon protein C